MPRRILGLISLVIVAGLIVACADDSGTDDDRRFANEPATQVATEATATELTQPDPEPTNPPLASPESLLHARGAPTVIYALVDGEIEIVDTTRPGEHTVIPAEPGRQFAGIASSPNGDRVAALTIPGEGSSDGADVVMFDQTGRELRRWSTIGDPGIQAATPVSGELYGETIPGTISWAAEGNSLLLVLDGRQLISVDINGDAAMLRVPERIHDITYAAWSPRGDKIALLANGSQGNDVIWVIDPSVDGESAIQVVPPNADASNPGRVTRFSWLPDGSGFAYILEHDTGSTPTSGQLYTLNLNTGIKLLVATPGRGGPAASIVDFVVAPDGKSIAYTIAIPIDDQWMFDSLWIRSFKSTNLYNVPVGTPDGVDQVWWTDSGIAWEQQTGALREIVLKPFEGDPQLLRTIEPGGPATPEATPIVGTPDVAPPEATPDLGTPGTGTPALATPRD